jgi:hypothetical protein
VDELVSYCDEDSSLKLLEEASQALWSAAERIDQVSIVFQMYLIRSNGDNLRQNKGFQNTTYHPMHNYRQLASWMVGIMLIN